MTAIDGCDDGTRHPCLVTVIEASSVHRRETDLLVVTDNDGVDNSSGETLFLKLGKLATN